MRLIPTVSLGLLICFCVAQVGCSGVRSADIADPFGVMVRRPGGRLPAYRVRRDMVPSVRSDEVPDRELSLADCVDIAMRNSPRSRIPLQSVRAQQAILGQTRGVYWPQLTVGTGWARQKEQLLTTSPRQENTDTEYNYTLSMSWTLADFGVRRAAVAGAEAAWRSAVGQLKSNLLDIGLAAENAYYRLVEAETLQGVAEQTVEQRALHLELARRRQRAGMGRASEVKQSEAELHEAEAALVDARAQVRDARGLLASVMGFEPSVPIRIQPLPENVRMVRPETVDQLLDRAERNRPILAAQAAQIAQRREDLALQRAARLPQLDAGMSWGLVDKHWLLPDGSNDEWAASLSLSMELFTGFQRTYRIRQLTEEVKAAELAYAALLHDVELEVWQSYSELIRVQEAIKAVEKFVESAQESLTETRREYEQGRVGIVDLIDVEQRYTQSLFAQVRTKLAFYLAVARLERSMGHGLERVPNELRE